MSTATVETVRRWSQRLPHISPIWPVMVLLFLVSPLLAAGSADTSALRSMIPFAALLAIASVGQSIVMRQRGLDLSVPGCVTLAAMVVTEYCGGHGSRLFVGILLAYLACILGGVVIALAVTLLRLTPLVATLGMNSVYIGVALYITGGVSTEQSPANLSNFALGSTAGISNIAIVAVVLIAVGGFLVGRTVAGRRFALLAENPAASRVAGIRVRSYLSWTFVAASGCYATTGILLAGFLQTPDLTVGTNYLLSTVAAVVLGGMSLGGRGNLVLSTAAGALFLTQLNQVVLGTSTSPSTQYIVQGAVIAVAMLVPTLRLPQRLRRASPPSSPTTPILERTSTP